MKTKKLWSNEQVQQVDHFKKKYDEVLKRTFIKDTPYILRELRNHFKFSQEQLSEFIGISKYSIAHYETGKSKIPSELIVKLACLYGVSCDVLLGLEDFEDPTEE